MTHSSNALIPTVSQSARKCRVANMLPLAFSFVLLLVGSTLHGQTTQTGKGNAVPLQSTPARVALGTSGHAMEFARSPLAFEPNLGQDASSAKFIANGPGYRVRLLPGKASLLLQGRADGSRAASGAHAVLDLSFAGAKMAAAISTQDPSQVRHSYFPTADRGTWRANLQAWNRVTYSSLYPGVNVTFYGNAGRLEYDFLLQPDRMRPKFSWRCKARKSSMWTLPAIWN